MRTATLYHGHVLDVLAGLSEGSVQCCVTSPPYFGLRDYKLPPQTWDGEPGCAHEWGNAVPGRQQTGGTEASGLGRDAAGKSNGMRPEVIRAQIEVRMIESPPTAFCRLCGAWRGSLGLEPTVQLYVQHMVQVGRAIWRVLRDDGTLWLNLGDSYANDGKWGGSSGGKHVSELHGETGIGRGRRQSGLKAKDLIGVPWRVALALQDDGWYLRSEIIWSKPAPMPESVRDRPTRAHEHVFLLSKSPTYFYDADAVREPISAAVEARPYKQVFNSAREDVGQPGASPPRRGCVTKRGYLEGAHGTAGQDGNGMRMPDKWSNPAGRNMRTVWEIGPEPCLDAHFATFPSEIPRRAILAGTSAAGCCAACGAPRVRETIRRFERTQRQRRGDNGAKPMDESNGWEGFPRGRTTATTTGWRPSCACGDGPVPCVVLDPFLGSGRSGVTALELGRSFVGIDLSQTYLETIARPAIEAALQAQVGEEEPPVLSVVEQGSLW